MLTSKLQSSIFIVLSALFIFISCSPPKKKEVVLYETYCTKCHASPDIKSLPKDIWEYAVLPEMGARMGIDDIYHDPMNGLSIEDQEAILKTGIYPSKPTISMEDWELIKEHIVSLAPVYLPGMVHADTFNGLPQFEPRPISLENGEGSFISFLKYDGQRQKILTGDISGNLSQYDYLKNESSKLGQFGSGVVDYSEKENKAYATAIGQLDPSEISSGKIFAIEEDTTISIPEEFHRPVNTLVHDLNNDGVDELVVSEFGNLTGKLSLLIKSDNNMYEKQVLLYQPGTIRVLAKDMNKDGKDDLIALISQGDESITILYQEDNMEFRPEKVIRFSPIYGSSWFELVDYDGDGDDDIITVNGDNADYSYVHKPYHGMRIHINLGNNQFKEQYFYPLNGASRFVARDFDQDGDIDFCILSIFPDYKNNPDFSVVYLENKNTGEFTFVPYTFSESKYGRWFLMDAGDIDQDGDEDIILSAFSDGFSPVQEGLSKSWKEKDLDLMILENMLKN